MSLSAPNDLSGQIFDGFLNHLKLVLKSQEQTKVVALKTLQLPKNPKGFALFLTREFLNYANSQRANSVPQASLLSQFPNAVETQTSYVMELFTDSLCDSLKDHTSEPDKQDEALALLLFFEGLDSVQISAVLNQPVDFVETNLKIQKGNLKTRIREKDLRT
jgi:hypothetical protein